MLCKRGVRSDSALGLEESGWAPADEPRGAAAGLVVGGGRSLGLRGLVGSAEPRGRAPYAGRWVSPALGGRDRL